MWLITKDLIDNGKDVGTRSRGPVGKPEEMPHKFKIKDADGEIYYYGISDEESHDPLHDFGMPNAGATVIQYYSQARRCWETL